MKIKLKKSRNRTSWYHNFALPMDIECDESSLDNNYYYVKNGQHKGKYIFREDCDVDIVKETVTYKLPDDKELNLDNYTIFNTGSGNDKAGLKHDKGKTRFDLYPLDAYEGCAKVLTFGSEKYTPNGWRTVSDPLNRYYAALIRHLNAQKNHTDNGEIGLALDEESKLPHLDHAQCCLVFLRELTKTK